MKEIKKNKFSIIYIQAFRVAGNSRIGSTVVDSQLVLNANGYGLNSTLDIVKGDYYNNGYSDFSVSLTSNDLS